MPETKSKDFARLRAMLRPPAPALEITHPWICTMPSCPTVPASLPAATVGSFRRSAILTAPECG